MVELGNNFSADDPVGPRIAGKEQEGLRKAKGRMREGLETLPAQSFGPQNPTVWEPERND